VYGKRIYIYIYIYHIIHHRVRHVVIYEDRMSHRCMCTYLISRFIISKNDARDNLSSRDKNKLIIIMWFWPYIPYISLSKTTALCAPAVWKVYEKPAKAQLRWIFRGGRQEESSIVNRNDIIFQHICIFSIV